MINSIVLDGIVVAVMALSIFLGYRRGFIKTISSVVAFAVAMAVSAVLGGPIAQFAYDKAVEPTVVETVAEHITVPSGENGEAAGAGNRAELEAKIDGALAQMPEYMRTLLENIGVKQGADVTAKLGELPNAAELPQTIADKVVRPVALPLLKTVCTLLLFIVVEIIVVILLNVLNIVAKLPLIDKFNEALGAVAGVLSGALWVLFLVSTAQVLAATGAFNNLVTEQALQDTHIMSWLITVNPLGRVLQEMMTAAGR